MIMGKSQPDVTNKFVGLRNSTQIGVCELFNGDCLVNIQVVINRERREELGINQSSESTKQHFENRFKMEGY